MGSKLRLLCRMACLSGLLVLSSTGAGLSVAIAQAGGTKVWAFDDIQAGGLPAGWRVEDLSTGATTSAWSVQAAADAPSKPNVLIARANPSGNMNPDMSYNLFWTDRPIFRDGTIEVRIKAEVGGEDQGGGIIWRVRDRNNYYLVRWNPMEEDISLFHVKDGTRKTLDSVAVTADISNWHTLSIRQKGDAISCAFDGKVLLKKRDRTFPAAGGVGLWTKLDVVTAFDDFTVSGSKAE